MFSWLRKSPRPPAPARENPGRGHRVRVALKNSRKRWKESCDLPTSLATALTALGHTAIVKGDWLELGELSLLPQVVNVEPEESGVKTTSTIQIAHASLVPGGLFEFQHASGTDVRDSFANGFKSWAELDLPVFLDALLSEPKTCMVMKSTEVLDRRFVFGPPLHMAQNPEATKAAHDFCPCCLFTNSIGAFEDLVRDTRFFGLELFVSRDAEGRIEADCRVNGVDLPKGAAALARYAKTWPDRGIEYRKQYVCIQTRTPKPA
jgi:hypothetical protein